MGLAFGLTFKIAIYIWQIHLIQNYFIYGNAVIFLFGITS